MFRTKKLNPVIKATGVIGVVTGLATAVTFALLTSTATLTANTITSATANLQVKSGGGFDVTDVGWDFNDNLTPGGVGETHTFFLRNIGDVNLGVTVYATPSSTTDPAADSKLKFCFTRVTGGPSTDCFTRAQMLANFNTLAGGPLTPETTADPGVQYDVNVSLDSSYAGSGVSVSPFDMVFTGTQQ